MTFMDKLFHIINKTNKIGKHHSYPKAFNVCFTVPSKICPGSMEREGCSSYILSVGLQYVIWCYFYHFFMPHCICKYFVGQFFKSSVCCHIPVGCFILASKDLVIFLQSINQILWSMLDNLSLLTSVFFSPTHSSCFFVFSFVFVFVFVFYQIFVCLWKIDVASVIRPNKWDAKIV